MGLRILIGRSGTGKSGRSLDEIKEIIRASTRAVNFLYCSRSNDISAGICTCLMMQKFAVVFGLK